MNFTCCVIFFTVLAACAAMCYYGTSLECYECLVVDSPVGKLCQDPFDDQVPLKKCKPNEVCMKQGTPEYTVGNKTIPSVIIRGCAPLSTCDEEPREYNHLCHLCSSNLCNSEVMLTPSPSNVIVLYIVTLGFQ